MASKPPILLIFSQVFVPDPASVGQHIADVAVTMAKRGHRVRVYCSNRGFEKPEVVYPSRENLSGADVRRLPFSSFGKKSLVTRGLGTLSLFIQFFFIGLFTPNVGGIFFSTSPPFIGFACALINLIKGTPIVYWAMDLNPDQLVAMGKIQETSFTYRVMESVNRLILRRSALIIALDRFMAKRITARGVSEEKLLVMPPWPHEDAIEDMNPADNPFRKEHGLTDKFVVMYSGNHSPANPLTTLLKAALTFKDHASLRFLFVGGGGAKKEVEALITEHSLTNVISLPYQPLSNLKYSLSAADVHVVSLGDDMIGIIHPCKIYGAMAVGRPILFLGPKPSHISDILDANPIGWHVAHGDVAAAEAALNTVMGTSREHLKMMGKVARDVLEQRLRQDLLCGQFCDRLEMATGMEALPAMARGT